MKYLNTRNTSLEDSVIRVMQGLSERVEYVEYDFKSKNDAMKAKRMLDGIQMMNFDINDDNINGGELMVDAGNKDMTKYHQEIIKKFRPKVMTTEKLVGGQKKLDKDKDGDIDGKDFAMLRKSKKENYELGTPENTKSKLDATPGQSADDWQKQVDTMQNKNNYMRETLAKMWGMKEGHNPFDDKKEKKEEKKDKKETKTMTGKPMTKVSVDPEMKETKIGKKNVR